MAAAAAAALLFFFYARRRQWLWPWVYPLFYLVLYWTPFINIGGGLTRGFGASLVLTAICLSDLGRAGAFAGGAFAALAFLCQQDLLAGLLVYGAICSIRSPEWPTHAKRAAAGASMIVITAGTWLLLEKALPAFVQQTFGFNVGSYPVGTPWERILMAGGTLIRGRLLPDMAVLGAATFIAARTRLRATAWLAPMIAFGAQHTATVFAAGHAFEHYQLALVPYAALAFGRTAEGFEKYRKHLTAALLLVLLALSPIPPNWARQIADVVTGRSTQAYAAAYGALRPALGGVAGKPGQLYVFRAPGALSLNTDLEILAPSPYVHTQMWADTPEWDPDGEKFNLILAGLERERTAFIVDGSPAFPVAPRFQQAWDAYVSRAYEEVSRSPFGAVFWRRKPETP
jgi:hypothetical protein